jgi:Leucine-rich repeat (LRR) protein
VIDLSDNKLTSLPAETRNGWGGLRELELRGNQLTSLPVATSKDPTAGWPLLVPMLPAMDAHVVAHLADVRSLLQARLELSQNRLRELPSDVTLFYSLRELYVAKNLLQSLPAELNTLTSLAILDVKENSLKQFKEEHFSNLSLQILDLSLNSLKSVPPALGRMTTLKVLSSLSSLLRSFRCAGSHSCARRLWPSLATR